MEGRSLLSGLSRMEKVGKFSGNRSVGKINQILYAVYTVFSSSGFFFDREKTRRKGRCKHLKEVIRRMILECHSYIFILFS